MKLAQTVLNDSPAELFLRQAVTHLKDEYLPKIKEALTLLDEDAVWWKPNKNSNSVGNLLLHLSGNVRQWLISGVGREPDHRHRDEEFAAEEGLGKECLLKQLEETVEEAVSVLENLSSKDLLETRHIQIFDPTVLQAVLHVVEHFSGHTGQILYITKMLKDKDLRFYNL